MPLIDWTDFSTWNATIRSLVEPLIPGKTIASWRSRTDLQKFYNDDLEWLKFLDIEMSSFEKVQSILTNALRHMRLLVYHACRPLNPALVYKSGLRTANVIDRRESLVKTMAALRIADPERKRILTEVDSGEHETDIDLGKLFLVLDKRDLIRSAGHYLLLGSEWQAATLGGSYYEQLRSQGIPTIFHVTLPLRWLRDDQREDLAKELLREWVRLQALLLTTVREKDFTIILRRPVPKSMIVGHSHPSVIPDWHSGGTERINEFTTCPACVRE